MHILTPATGNPTRFFDKLPDVMHCFQWHSAEVKTAPEAFQILAESDLCAIQSLGLAGQVLTTQYHQEIISTTVSEWSEIPEYKNTLEECLGANAVEKLEKRVSKYMDMFNKTARHIYENWKSVVF